jgi:hypothetical protein
VRIFKTKWFARFARKQHIGDDALREAVSQAEQGLIGAQLSGDLIKQRLARPGKGKSGGYRTLIAFRSSKRAVFLYGFGKNERDNIGDDELATLKEIARAWIAADAARIASAIRGEELQELDEKNAEDEQAEKE